VGDVPVAEDHGDLLLVVNHGRVPPKIAKRLPIGLALTYAAGSLSPAQASRARRLAAQGLVTWINYPELGPARGTFSEAHAKVGGETARLELVMAADQVAKAEWERARGVTIASAITRLITRLAAGQVTKKVAGDGLAGFLLSLATQATLTATDVPDTRSWATLPARITFVRLSLPAGEYPIELEAGGKTVRETITVPKGGWAVASLTSLR
jgi:uncharacterized protein